jgi:hypothetical protein
VISSCYRRLRSQTVLPAGWFIATVAVVLLLTVWVTFTLTRLDRLHARVDAAQAALDAQLVRRAAALQHVAGSGGVGLSDSERSRYQRLAEQALAAGEPDREAAENEIGRAVSELASTPDRLTAAAAAELREAGTRVQLARGFYNDAVRDTRALRRRRMPRVLHLAGRRGLPLFFDIDDTMPVAAEPEHSGDGEGGRTRPPPPGRPHVPSFDAKGSA